MGDLVKIAKEIIEKIKYLNIATVGEDGQPWNTPVYVSYDDELNFYWMSWKKNQHSLNVEDNPRVFGTLYDSTAPFSAGMGVYIQGNATRLTNPVEILVSLKTHYDRSKGKVKAVEKFLENFPRRVYKLVPEKVWVNGDKRVDGEPIDFRTEISLDELRDSMKNS